MEKNNIVWFLDPVLVFDKLFHFVRKKVVLKFLIKYIPFQKKIESFISIN